MDKEIEKKTKRIAVLSELLTSLQEKKRKIFLLNKYDFDDKNAHYMSVEFGGGSAHAKLILTNNKDANKFTDFVTHFIDGEIIAIELELAILIK
ncbi:hypothetical protein LCGC14_1282080 [marine sediment metagenome]|uniref:Uncharacterized protein n=1 Tax=marine sediment metagenome TaxID=412755 RepID=A0A0F9NBG5_9ZZZZ